MSDGTPSDIRFLLIWSTHGPDAAVYIYNSLSQPLVCSNKSVEQKLPRPYLHLEPRVA
jgi:hypothetical protein